MPPRSGNIFGSSSPLRVRAAPTVAADPATEVAGLQLARHTLYLRTVGDVRSGALSPDDGYARLNGAGFPDSENPFAHTSGSFGAALHDVAAPLGLSRSTNAAHEAAQTRAAIANAGDATALKRFDKTGFADVRSAPKSGGTISPGTGMVAQLLTGVADKSIYDPAGLYSEAAHPVRTGEQIARNVAHVVEHPGSDPANAALLGWAALSGGAAGLSRIFGAAGALKAGEGVDAAAGRSSAAGGSLLHTPAPAPRAFTVGDTELHLLPSRNPVFRAAQAGHDKVVQAAITNNPEGRLAGYGTRRLGNALTETRRYTQPMQAAPAQTLNRAGKSLDKADQAALRLTAEQSTPEERIALHEQQAQAGVNPKEQAQQIKLMNIVRKRGLVTTDEHGNVVIDAAKHPQLAAVDAQLRGVGATMAGTVERTGQMTAEDLASRADRPNQIVGGGRWVEPTPGRLGKPSQALVRQRARVGRLEVLHERALGKAAATATPYPNVHTTSRGIEVPANPPNAGIAGVDLAQLDERIARTERRAAQTPIDARDQHEINGAKRQVATLRGIRDDATRRGGRTPGVPSDLPAKGATNPITDRLGSALSVERDRLAQMESAAANRVAPTGIVGGAAAREGRQYVPYYGTEPKGVVSAIARGGRAVVGRAQPVISPSRHMTGEALLAGHVPDNTTGLVARAAERQTRYENTDTFRRAIVQAGSDTRQSNRDVLVNTQELKDATVPEETQIALGQKQTTLDELDHHAHAFEEWRRRVVPGFAGEADATLGTPAPEGFRWVDKHLLGDLANPTSMPNPVAAQVGKTFDTVNAAQTAATVYFKPGHVATRALTNAATNIVQGSATPVGIGRSVRLWQELDPATRMQALAAAGEGGIHAMPAEAMNVVGRIARAGALWWSKHFDSPFRFNSLAYEARKAGIDTPEKFKQMLDDMEHPERLTSARAAQVDAIAKNANREAIAYDRLSEFEKTYLRRAFWFYPWLKGSSIFAGRTVLEHPFKSAALAELGTVGAANAHHDLGDVPSYEQGLFRVGGSGALPLVVNPTSVSPFSTPAEIVDAVLHANHPTQAEQLSNFLTPGLSLAAHEAFHLGPFGQQLPASASSAEILKEQVGSATPEVTLARRLEGPHPGSMFPVTRAQALEQFGAGAVSPKTADRAVLNTQAENERLDALAAAPRAGARVTNQEHAVEQQARALGLHLPPVLARVYSIQRQREEAYAALGGHASQQSRLHADLLLAVHLGDVTSAQAQAMLDAAASATPAEIEKARGQINDAFFGGSALGQLRSALNQATAAAAANH